MGIQFVAHRETAVLEISGFAKTMLVTAIVNYSLGGLFQEALVGEVLFFKGCTVVPWDVERPYSLVGFRSLGRKL